MGSLGSLKNKLKMPGTLRFNEKLVHKLFMARQKRVLHHVAKLGFQPKEGDTLEDMQVRLKLLGIELIPVKKSDDNPRENTMWIVQNGHAIVGVSEPFIDGGDIIVRDVPPSFLSSGELMRTV